LAARLGLGRELSGVLAHLFRRRPRQEPGRVLVDLATSLIDGGDCVSDLGVLAEQPDLFGSVASQSTATRLLYALGERELLAIRAARRAARERAWAAGARPATIRLDFDAQLLECQSEKEGAAAHRKGGFGFHPLQCFLDETGEQLAALLRPGNAGANTGADHVSVLEAALAQLPAELRERDAAQPPPMLARADSAGARHEFAKALRWRKIGFSLGYYVDERVGEAALALPKRRWRRALDADGSPRPGAWVAELTGRVDLSAWPLGTRLIVRKERPHPGAQLRFSDRDGHRYTCFISDQNDKQIAALERRHRLHARVEDRIQESQELGFGRLSSGRCSQPRLVRARAARARPARLAAPARARRPARAREAETTARQTVARRRPHQPLRTPPHTPPAARLAMGARPARRIRAPTSTRSTRLSTTTAAASSTHADSRPRRAQRPHPRPQPIHQTTTSTTASDPPCSSTPTNPVRAVTLDPTRHFVPNRG
jgi:hypothetical protein